MGYQVSIGLLDAADYGVPQGRKRAIFIGSRDHELGENCEEPELTDLLPVTHAKEPEGGLRKWITLGTALEYLPRGESEGAMYSQARAEVLERVPPGANWRFLRDKYGEEYLRLVMGGAYESAGGKVGFWRRLAFDKPSPTLPVSPVQKATCLCHPEEIRPLNVREYARVQQFPDGYDLAGTTSAKYMQIGNAVPVELARAVGKGVARLLDMEKTPYQGSLFRNGVDGSESGYSTSVTTTP